LKRHLSLRTQLPAYNFIMRLFAFIFVLMGCAGCGVISSQSVYEGVRSQQKANNAGVEPKQPTLPSYQQYEKERDTLKK